MRGLCPQGLVIFLAHLSSGQHSHPGGPHHVSPPHLQGPWQPHWGSQTLVGPCLAITLLQLTWYADPGLSVSFSWWPSSMPATWSAFSPRKKTVVSVWLAGSLRSPLETQPCPARQWGRERGAEGQPRGGVSEFSCPAVGSLRPLPLDGSPCPQASWPEQRGGWSSHLKIDKEES